MLICINQVVKHVILLLNERNNMNEASLINNNNNEMNYSIIQEYIYFFNFFIKFLKYIF